MRGAQVGVIRASRSDTGSAARLPDPQLGSSTYLALLRAVNLGSHQKVSMADLRSLLTDLGFADARSLLNSGNLAFRSRTRTGASLERLLETEAARRLDLNTDFFVRTAQEWDEVVARNPFPEEAKRDPGHLVVMVLKDAPDAKDVEALRAAITGPEIVRAGGRQAYIVYPAGIGKSRLTNVLIEKKLGTRGTGRNWNTVLKLAAIAGKAFIAALSVATAAHAQGQAALPVPENLVADGIPPVPASLAEEVRRYTEYRAAGLADWHPTRREMLIVTRFANTPQIHQVKLPRGARTQLTFFDEPVSFASYEPRAGKYFLFTKDVGGNEFAQIYRYDLAGGRVTPLTHGERSQNGGIRWSGAGNRIAYGSTRRTGADRDIYLMDPEEPRSDRLLLQVQGSGWGVSDWSPDDRRLIVAEFLSVNQSFLWLVVAETGARTELTPRQSPDTVAYGAARFTRDGKGVYVTTDRGSEFLRLSYLDLATRRIVPLTAGIEHDVTAFELSPDGRTIGFTVNAEGVSKLYLLDTSTRRHREVRAVPPGLIGGLDWHGSGRVLGFALSTVRSAGDVYSLDLGTGAVTRWTESETGGLDTAALADPTLIRWTSFDGREISGFYYRPAATFSGRRPVVIDIHGGPESQSLPGFQGRENHLLTELGVALIYPNARGSTGYGKSFTKLDNGAKRLDAVRDIGGLLDWIARQPDFDSSRVMVTGGSYGGYMTLAVATM